MRSDAQRKTVFLLLFFSTVILHGVDDWELGVLVVLEDNGPQYPLEPKKGCYLVKFSYYGLNETRLAIKSTKLPSGDDRRQILDLLDDYVERTRFLKGGYGFHKLKTLPSGEYKMRMPDPKYHIILYAIDDVVHIVKRCVAEFAGMRKK